MTSNATIDLVPIWGVLLITLVLVIVSVEVGYQLGCHKRHHKQGEPEAPVGAVVGAMLGLLAFILAFTFSNAASRFENRKEILLDEVNTIETTHLRASFLPDPEAAQARDLLLQYVKARVELAQATVQSKSQKDAMAHAQEALNKSSTFQTQLWDIATRVAHLQPPSIFNSLFVESLNDMFDLHTERVTVAYQYRIPGNIWYALYFISTLSMGTLGFQFGMTGKGGRHVSFALALAFAAVILLIADLDRSSEGRLRVSQQPMFDLLERLEGK